MSSADLTMLWESTDARVALAQRFQFDSVEAAAAWITHTLAATYDMPVITVDRLVISAANLLAWLTTNDGPLIVKCSAWVDAHARLSDIAELLVWLDQEQIPVSVPLRARTGQRQVRCEHLSVGVQRVVPGTLLDPTQLVQARTAGLTLAQLHHALAAYPRANNFVPQSPIARLEALINDELETRRASVVDPVLVAGSNAVANYIQQRALPAPDTRLVHGDYRAANVLWHAENISAVLDFEDVRWGYRINDLAWAAVHLGTRFRAWGPVSAEVHATFLTGYESRRRLTEAERAWLPVLMTWQSVNLANAATELRDAARDAVRRYTRWLEGDPAVFPFAQ